MMKDCEKYTILNRGVQENSIDELVRLCQKIAAQPDYDWKNYSSDVKKRPVLNHLPISGGFQERSCRDGIIGKFNMVAGGTQRDLEYLIKTAKRMLEDLRSGIHKKI